MNEEIFKLIIRIHELCTGRSLTLSAAESCTGGLISHCLTTPPGAGDFFSASVISYSVEAKKNILGVSPDVIKKHGVVSGETAKEMAEKVRSLSQTDLSVATTGNLGPDVLEGKDKGLVYIAASKEGRTIFKELRLQGDRGSNKEEAAKEALNLLIELIAEE